MDDFDDAPLPTLEEAAELAKKSKVDLFQGKPLKIHRCESILYFYVMNHLILE